VQDRANPVDVAFSIVSLVLPSSCCLSLSPFLSLSLFLCLLLLLLVGEVWVSLALAEPQPLLHLRMKRRRPCVSYQTYCEVEREERETSVGLVMLMHDL